MAATITPEEILVGFARVLRAAGLPVTMAATQLFLDAVTRLDYGHRPDVYWAGRAVFCTGADHIPTYDRAFAAWFSSASATQGTPLEPGTTTGFEAGFDEPGEGGGSATIAALASPTEWLRHRDIAELTPAELAWVAGQFRTLRVRLPRRPTRRREPATHGTIDRVRTLREQRRRAGEPGPLRYARRRQRPRRVIFLIDVSGSMKPYADSLLRLAHRVLMHAPGGVDVFAVGTRLTPITRALNRRDPQTALQAAGAAIPDWAGGTRLADNLEDFLRRWGRRGIARGATIVIASDGWERGDPTQLGIQLGHLNRLSHRIVWSNPHAGLTGYEPIQGGIAAALPHIDVLVAGHSFAAFENVLLAVAEDRSAAFALEGSAHA